MDFIERILHISPDGGNGLTEWAFVLVCVCACLTFAVRIVMSKLSARDSGSFSYRRSGSRSFLGRS
jgi:hypothetical protein